MATPVANSVPLLTAVNNNNGTLTDEFISGLVQGGSWTFGGGPQTLTYSFSINDTPGFQSPWTPALQNAFVQALASWSSVANISFVETGSGGVFLESTADIAATLTVDELYPAVGFGIFPDPNVANLLFSDPESPYTRENWPQPEGDVFFSDAYEGFSYLNAGGFGLEVMVHEIGHALGLKHSADDGANGRPTFAQLGISSYDTGRWTVMSNNETSFSVSSGQVATPMPLDILAIQQIYGANMTFHAGDDVYAIVSDSANPYKTIWDAGGTDSFDASGHTQGVTIDLRPGVGYAQGASASDGFTAIAFNVTIENAVGGAFNDSVTGNDAANNLTGSGGNDTLNGGAGGDVLYGNHNDDSLRGESGNDSLYGGQNNDAIFGGEGDDFIQGNFGNDIIGVGAGDDSVHGGQGDDTLLGSIGDDTFDGGVGHDVVDYGGLSINLWVDIATGIVTAAADTQFLLNFEVLIVGGGNDTLVGALANDTLDGSGGDDSVTGGAGDDYLLGGAGADALFGNQNADFLGGDAGDDNLSGGQDNDTLDGGSGNDSLAGGVGNDSLFGGGDSILGFGSDTLAGGQDNDLYRVASAGITVVEGLGEGIDTVDSGVSFVLPANVEHLTLTNLFSSGFSNINGTGNDLDNTLTGTAADNVLDGGAGNDTLVGGYGFDTYVLDSVGDLVIEDNFGGIFGGIDLVQSALSYELPEYVENLTLTGNADINGTGNDYDNALNGNAGNNLIDGAGGSDRIQGGAGNDTLVGGDDDGSDVLIGDAGADSMQGGDGWDLYAVDDAGDTVVENADEGLDTVDSEVTFVLPANVEHLLLLGNADLDGTGNELDNSLAGNAGSNLLSGGTGNDTLGGGAGTNTLIGGDGNDWYFVSNATDTVIENADAGIDLLTANGVSLVLPDNVENLNVIAYGDGASGTGNDLDNVLNGDFHTNVLIGGAGNDTLNAGGGLDTLLGGLGDDVYSVGGFATDNPVVEYADEGIDLVQTYGFAYVLPAHVENLELTFFSVSGTGNSLDNVLTGNSGNNILDGGAGNDTLTGGDGSDTYVVDAAGDTVTENPGEGADQVQATTDYALGANVEKLVLLGAAVSGWGNELANVLIGNAAGNLLDGLGGADTLAGGAGDDVYTVDEAGDSVSEAALPSTARVSTSAEGAEGNHLSSNAAISADGHYVVFTSSATNLAGVDANGYTSDVYIKNLETGAVTRVSTDSDGVQANDSSSRASVSADGRHVAFSSTASNLVSGDTNGASDIFVKDLQTGTLVRASTSAGGGQGDSYAFFPSLSANGRYVAFESNASNLVAGDTNGIGDIFVKDLVTGGIVRASTASDGSQLNFYSSGDAVISADGSHVAFERHDGINFAVYVKDLITGTLVVASGASDGTPANSASFNAAISADGRYVTFESLATNLVAGDTNGVQDIFIKDLVTGVLTRVSTDSNDAQGNAISANAALSADGRYVSFESFASNLVEGDTLGLKDIFLKDLVTGTVVRVSTDSGGSQSNNSSYDAALSADGHSVVFNSYASNLVTGDTNGQEDVFLAVITPGDAGGTDEIHSSVSYTLPADFENLTLTGPEDITGTGNDASNLISGNSAGNTLSGLLGNDSLAGEDGDDTLYGNQNEDSLAGGAGNDSLFGGQGNDVVGGDAGDDNIQGNLGDDAMDGGDGNDTLHGGQGNDTLSGGAGNDSLVGGLGNDTVSYAAATGDVMVDLAVGTATGTESGSDTLAGFEAVIGGAGGDTLGGGAGNDYIQGNLGDDVMDGEDGADTLHGGQGNDTLTGGAGNDSLVGGLGNDTADYAAATGNLVINLAAGTAASAQLGADTLLGIEGVIAGAGNDVLTGSDVNDALDGGAGNDSLLGGLGNDDVLGSAGNDTLFGNQGDDFLSGGGENDLLFGGQGNDNVAGDAGDDNIQGNLGDDVMAGGDDNDTLHGGQGNDTLAGGAGNDSLVGGLDADWADYAAAVAGVSIDLGAGLAIGEGIDTLAGFEHVRGSAADDAITGDDSANVLDGGVGDDSLVGGAGDDTLFGGLGDLTVGLGHDTLAGGEGNDTLEGGSGNDSLVGGAGDDSLSGGPGIFFSIYPGNPPGDTLVGGDGNDTLEGYMGNDSMLGGPGDDSMLGGSAGDTLLGGDGTGLDSLDGDDVLNGGTGNDSLMGGPGDDSLNGGEDTVAGEGYAVARGDDTLVGGDGNDFLDGGQKGNDSLVGGLGQDNLSGGLDSDTLIGGDGTGLDTADGGDLLDGGNGNDFLIAGYGDDTLDGGADNDWASYGSAAGAVTVNLATGSATGDGTDTLIGVENVLGSVSADEITGDDNANVLSSGDGNDTLDGGGGNDTLAGGVGSDGLAGGADNDWASYSAAGGAVTVNLATGSATGDGTDTLTGIENVLGSNAADSITGNDSANALVGGDGNDTLDGGYGEDSLMGGLGDDSLYGGNEPLAFGNVLDGGAGNDTLVGDIGDDSLAGGAGDDSLFGGNDYYDFGGEKDTLDGGAGNDTLVGDFDNDTLVGGAGDDVMDGGADNDAFRYDATILDSDDVAANAGDTIAATAGDVISMLGLTDELTIGGEALSALTADVAVGSTLSTGETNIAFVGGVLQVDLDGNGVFNAGLDFQITISGVTTVTYNVTDDLFHLS